MKNLLLLSLSVVALSSGVVMAQPEKAPAEQTASEKPNMSPANEKEFRMAIAGPGNLSLMTSKIAEKKATNADVMDFAKFEDGEQTAIASVLEDLGTPKPTLTPDDQAKLDKLNAAKKGPAFDKAYMQIQLDGHKILQTQTGNFLDNSKGDEQMEKEARHLATLAKSTIDSHVAMSKKMLAKMK